ncbi:ferrous iron transporter B [Candidatus Saganbacteria bacterium]|nr:ferrous iron transporter B [Candidatus Saganbacteria bacterium]
MPEADDTGDILEISLERIENLLKGDYGISRRSVGLLLLQEDREIITLVKNHEPESFNRIKEIIDRTKTHYREPLSYIIALDRQQEASRIAGEVIAHAPKTSLSLKEKISRMMINPISGIPIMLLILYYGIYKFVGEFGAGTVVDFIETDIFEKIINPRVTQLFASVIPWQVFRELFVGEYGVITLGVRYAVALILPIVTTFFIAFAVIEDTGYLPRLALLIDRVFKKIGLSGRAVIPMVLGLGCDTMATMVTRTLPTIRERVIATILLALAIPCSAQLGVILALLEGHSLGLWVWLGVVGLVFLLVGFLSSKILPGGSPSFYMEIPPLRLPKLSNVFIKTATRVKWYFTEIFPMFIFASVLIWAGQLTGLFGLFTNILEYPVRWIGLPDKAAVAFLFGFFRRDYGAAGLYDLKKAGLFSGNQLVVAAITLTLFLPCIAQFLMNVKERGWKTGLAISVFILFFSFSVGFAVNLLLNIMGISL